MDLYARCSRYTQCLRGKWWERGWSSTWSGSPGAAFDLLPHPGSGQRRHAPSGDRRGLNTSPRARECRVALGEDASQAYAGDVSHLKTAINRSNAESN